MLFSLSFYGLKKVWSAHKTWCNNSAVYITELSRVPNFHCVLYLQYFSQLFLIVLFVCSCAFTDVYKHGNEADFLGFLQKSVPHESLALPFEPFRFWFRIRKDIHNLKTTPRLPESASRRLSESESRGSANSPTWRVWESMTLRLTEEESFLLKGHGNEADFLGFLQKSVPHESLTIPLEPFQFCLRIRSIFVIKNDSPTRRVGESTRLPIDTIFF